MARLAVKPGVQPKLVEVMALLSNVAAEVTDVELITITSAMDSTHSRNSLHYALRAVDIRTKNFPNRLAKQRFVALLQARFGRDYDILLEGEGTDNEHIHLEFDPK